MNLKSNIFNKDSFKVLVNKLFLKMQKATNSYVADNLVIKLFYGAFYNIIKQPDISFR